jgi:hypothetical protein
VGVLVEKEDLKVCRMVTCPVSNFVTSTDQSISGVSRFTATLLFFAHNR